MKQLNQTTLLVLLGLLLIGAGCWPAKAQEWRTHGPALKVMLPAPSGRSISFPCRRAGDSLGLGCWSDPVGERMVLVGDRRQWENYLICFRDESSCVAVGMIWPAEPAR